MPVGSVTSVAGIRDCNSFVDTRVAITSHSCADAMTSKLVMAAAMASATVLRAASLRHSSGGSNQSHASRRRLIYWLLWLLCFLQLFLYFFFRSRQPYHSCSSLQNPRPMGPSAKLFVSSNDPTQDLTMMITNQSQRRDNRTFYDICVIVETPHNNQNYDYDDPLFRGAIFAERFANMQRAKVLLLMAEKQQQNHNLTFVQEDAVNHMHCFIPTFSSTLLSSTLSASNNSSLDMDDRVHGYLQSYWPFPMIRYKGDKRHSEEVLLDYTCLVDSMIQHMTSQLGHIHSETVVDVGKVVHTKKCGKVYNLSASDKDTTIQNQSTQHDRHHQLVVNPLITLQTTTRQSLSWHESETSTVDLIICRCEEDFQWIAEWQNLLHFRHIYVYNKCGQQPNQSIIEPSTIKVITEWIHLPNTGREGAAWIHHMLRLDIDFAYQNIFVQGEPETTEREVQSFLQALPYIPEFPHFYDLCKHPSFFDEAVHQQQSCWSLMSSKCSETFNVTKVCAFHQTYASTGRTCAQAIPTLRGEFYTTAQAIRRHVVARRVLFQQLLDILNQDNDPDEGHLLERCWGEILSGND